MTGNPGLDPLLNFLGTTDSKPLIFKVNKQRVMRFEDVIDTANNIRTLDLTKSYAGRTVVRGVSLEVSSGEIVGLLGPNGAGKTTTFYMTVGLTQPDSGRVELDGRDVTDDPMYIRARKGIGYLPQEPSIFRGLTVEQNLLAILETMELDGAARRARLGELLAELSLTPLA